MRKRRDKQPEAPRPGETEERQQPEPLQQQEAGQPEAARKDEAAEQEQTLAEFEDKYRRAVADLANAHKRFQKERKQTGKLAVAAFVGRLLPMVDSMSHSLKSAQESHDARALIEGFQLIEAQMLQILGDSGIELIESVGKPFDPEVHHAVATEVRVDVPPGTVVDELGRGFSMDGLVVRPAQVKVAVAPPEPEAAGEEADGRQGEN